MRAGRCQGRKPVRRDRPAPRDGGGRIAVPPPRHSPDQQHDPGLQIHPDAPVALRLADEPVIDGGPPCLRE